MKDSKRISLINKLIAKQWYFTSNCNGDYWYKPGSDRKKWFRFEYGANGRVFYCTAYAFDKEMKTVAEAVKYMTK